MWHNQLLFEVYLFQYRPQSQKWCSVVVMENSGVYCDNENPVHDMSSSFWCDVKTAGHLQIDSSWGHLMAAKVLLAPLWGRLICSRTCSPLSLHQGADHRAGVKVAQVVVSLPCTHKHNRLTCDVRHRDGSTDLRGRQERSGRINQQIPFMGVEGKKNREGTLSSIVSNFVRTIPSIRRGLSDMEWSARAWLNFTWGQGTCLVYSVCMEQTPSTAWIKVTTLWLQC